MWSQPRIATWRRSFGFPSKKNLPPPKCRINLRSVGKIDSKGCSLTSKEVQFQVKKSGALILKGKVKNGLFSLDNPDKVGPVNNQSAHITNSNDSIQELHKKIWSCVTSLNRGSWENWSQERRKRGSSVNHVFSQKSQNKCLRKSQRLCRNPLSNCI